MRYLLDFDRTLMDTDRLKAVTADDDLNHLVGNPEFWEYYRASDFLYPDVMAWLMKKAPEEVHILTAFKPSQGEFAKLFQEGKILSGGFREHVGSVTVMEGQKGAAAREIAAHFPAHEPIAFVDDLIEQCLSVKTALPQAECFVICRHGRAEAQLPPGLHYVTCLSEVDAIMDKL